ncbi:MAG: response regulator transcription factor [bacterium]|nr:response regulator transcription factor [bacterium]
MGGEPSNREIADRLFVSPGTIKTHTHNLYRKLGVSNRREVVTKALELGILGARQGTVTE